ncbi:MAG: ribosomal protein L13e [Candidatus Hydrothermarchaeaceae archaeon]
MVKVISAKGYREGRGFSLGELKSAGVSPSQARRVKIGVDVRRRSTHDFNVKELSEIASRLIPRMKTSNKGKGKERRKKAGAKSIAKGSRPKKTTGAKRTKNVSSTTSKGTGKGR